MLYLLSYEDVVATPVGLEPTVVLPITGFQDRLLTNLDTMPYKLRKLLDASAEDTRKNRMFIYILYLLYASKNFSIFSTSQ